MSRMMSWRLGLSMIVSLVFVSAVYAADGDWMTDLASAQKAAAERKVPILVDFSGSDWCGWCIKLDKEVFSQDAFKKFAKDNLVLLLLDFPRRKEQSEEVKKANNALAEKYGIEGFPTVLILDAEGKVIGRTGYQPGGAEKYVAHIQELLKAAPAGEKKAQDAAGK